MAGPVVDKDDFYRLVNVRGTAEIVEQGADEHIDKLAKKYLGADSYPWRKEGEQRIIVRVVPDGADSPCGSEFSPGRTWPGRPRPRG